MIKPFPTAGSTNCIAASIDVGLRATLTLSEAGDAIGPLWELVGLSNSAGLVKDCARLRAALG
jgi:hypothetical protein